jgi:hypothetical protein
MSSGGRDGGAATERQDKRRSVFGGVPAAHACAVGCLRRAPRPAAEGTAVPSRSDAFSAAPLKGRPTEFYSSGMYFMWHSVHTL